jgi:hypothetical protein
MEYLLAGYGIVSAFLYMWFYRRGVKDGLTMHEKRIEPIIKPPMTKEEKKKAEQEKTLLDEINNLFSYQPSHIGAKDTGVKDID